MNLRGFNHLKWKIFCRTSHEGFLNGTSSTYIEEMYNLWRVNPKSVHASWDFYFRNITKGRPPEKGYQRPPTLGANKPNEIPLEMVQSASHQSKPNVQVKQSEQSTPVASSENFTEKDIKLNQSISDIIRSYQVRGHLVADLDPLRIKFGNQSLFYDRQGQPDQKVLRTYLTPDFQSNLDKSYPLPPNTFIGTAEEKTLPIREIFKRMETVYCQTLGSEFMHIETKSITDWIKERLETPGAMEIPNEKKTLTLKRLIRSTGFENFLAKKWPGEKRFGLEGCDILIPAMKTIIDRSSDNGVESFILGMPHRGRLNVLANVCRKPLVHLFNQFRSLEAEEQGSGDVKYHLGTYTERLNRQTKKHVKLSVVANPSHLEAVNPIVQGKCRAEQFYLDDSEGKKVMSMLIHGDAAFAGQGIVYETFHLTNLPMYTTNGTIHIVVNNQIGFTTDPRFSRSSPYCTDVGKVVEAPIFHVNADDPEKVIFACNLAADYRATYGKDVVIDIVGYRRNGHNEVDEPMFTQPLMYKKIRARKPILELYSEKLIKEGVVTEEFVNTVKSGYLKICEDSFEEAKNERKVKYMDWLDSPWYGFFSKEKDVLEEKNTGVKEDVLIHIGNTMSTPPPENLKFVIHKGIERILKGRMEMVNARRVDWPLAESMAFGSLLMEGIHVRLSGQDSERGTFSHRHHILHHQEVDKETYSPLSKLTPTQGKYIVCNSSLSEYAVLGFELGYSMTNPNALIMWEAQFGDFNNNAQCIIDQFICSGQTKWVRQSGLVMLLPHGMEGMGPEHSSARLERFLQLCEEDEDIYPQYSTNLPMQQLFNCNWIIANLTTPANYFHILRRQIALNFRKPLVIMSPKFLLRLPQAQSSFDEMTEKTNFKRVIVENGEASQNPSNVRKLIFCSGKVYYDLVQERKRKDLEKDIAITTIEQISPFPFDIVKTECEKYDKAEIFWVQEEHKNQGAWSYVKPRIITSTNNERMVKYEGRIPSASPATGSKAQHNKELVFIEKAISI